MPGIRFVISAAALVAALATSAAQADEVAPVIVSAVRTPTPADQVAQSVTVLDAATLRRLYPGGELDYLTRFTVALEAAIGSGFILAADRAEILALAAAEYSRVHVAS